MEIENLLPWTKVEIYTNGARVCVYVNGLIVSGASGINFHTFFTAENPQKITQVTSCSCPSDSSSTLVFFLNDIGELWVEMTEDEKKVEKVNLCKDEWIIDVAAGDEHVLVLNEKGTVFSLYVQYQV